MKTCISNAKKPYIVSIIVIICDANIAQLLYDSTRCSVNNVLPNSPIQVDLKTNDCTGPYTALKICKHLHEVQTFCICIPTL